MTMARKFLVDATVTPFYHCISRCVRRAFLCGEGREHRKQWIEERLQELAGLFAVKVCGFSVMDNHLHVLLRLDLAQAAAWTDLEVVQKWLTLCPPKGVNGERLKLVPSVISARASDTAWVAVCRSRLADLGWFMKFLKEPISRRANREDRCTGAFWEGRYKSIAILDEASLLATCAYIDLNPVAAGIAATPEKSPHTSLKSRVDHCASKGKLDKLRAGSPYVSQVQLEKGHWLFPIEDQRNGRGEGLAGMLHGISLTGYLQLVDWSSRLVRPGKQSVAKEAPAILARLQIDATGWQATLEKLVRSTKKLVRSTKRVGSYFGSSDHLQKVAAQKNRRFLKNLTGRDTQLTGPHAG